jgi:hypothetical protein
MSNWPGNILIHRETLNLVNKVVEENLPYVLKGKFYGSFMEQMKVVLKEDGDKKEYPFEEFQKLAQTSYNNIPDSVLRVQSFTDFFEYLVFKQKRVLDYKQIESKPLDLPSFVKDDDLNIFN